MTSCDRIQEALPEMADATLGAREIMEVVEHLRACASCSASWKRHLGIQHHFLEFEPKRPDSYWPHQRREILEQITWNAPAEDTGRFLRAGRLSAAAVAAAFLLVLTWAAFRTPAPAAEEVSSTRPAPAMPKHESPAPAPTPPRVAPTVEAPSLDRVPETRPQPPPAPSENAHVPPPVPLTDTPEQPEDQPQP
ncbi:MAG: zf-HC2 domain-containing protein, partial [Planctomycetes bacterium]|nr:zf-HC2 domain-containing protein [Planctomycetota bacterium]